MTVKDVLQNFSEADLICYPEIVDLEVYREFLKPNIEPREEPNGMVVGALFDWEASVIKNFFEREYGIKKEKTKVAGCSLENRTIFNKEKAFDYLKTGRIEGDASYCNLWLDSLNKMKIKNFSYDLVSIRNPDLVNIDNWTKVYLKSLEYLEPKEGALITLIREEDVERYEKVEKNIKKISGIEPVLYGETGVEYKDAWINPQHTIGIFKNSY